MDNLIEIKDLSFSYLEKNIFDNLNSNIKKCKWTTIVGLNGSGKTTLSKLINNEYKYSGIITTNNKKICLIDDNFKYDDILVSKIIKKYYDKEIYNEVISKYNLKNITKKKVNKLNYDEKVILLFCIKLSINPDIIIIDNILENLEYINKDKIIKILKDMDVNIINITNNMDDTLLGDNIIIIDNGKIILNDIKENVFNNYEIVKKIGLELPFVVDLSIKLKYYNLVNKIYFNEEELIGAIWM